MTRSSAAPGGTIHSAGTPAALTASHLTSRATCSLTFSIAPRIRPTEAVGSRGTALIISSTFANCSLAISYAFSLAIRQSSLSASQRAAQQPARQLSGMFVIAQEDFAVDHGRHQTGRLLLEAARPGRQIVIEVWHHRRDLVRIEDDH